MLHILWILLKFILILLGILLGLILLAVILILFCPVRYRASTVKETDSFRKISAKARVSWLFGAISFHMQYKEGAPVFDFRLFGIPLLKLIQKLRSRHNSAEPEVKDTHASHADTKDNSLSGKESILLTDNKENSTTSVNTELSTISVPDKSEATAESPCSSEEDSTMSEREKDLEYARKKIGNFFYRLGSILRSLWNRINRLWQKICQIPSSIENFTLTIQNICGKIESYQKFMEHPRTKAAFTLVKNRLFRLLRHVFPTRIQGRLIFGSTDPSVTGAVLAVLGMTIPLHKNCITVTPLFEDRNVLRGNVQLKGRIYGIVLLKTAVELYFNKNIKYVIRRWKHKED